MEAFEKYDWEGEERWKTFISAIDFVGTPEEEKQQIRKLKMRFYKNNIDPTFSDPSQRSTSSSTSSSSNSSSSTSYSPPPTTSSSSSSRSSSSTSSRSPSSSSSKITVFLQLIWVVAHFSLLVNAILYILPFSGEFTTGSYQRMLFSALIAYGVSLYTSVGIPSFNGEFMSRIATNDNFHYLLLSMFLLNSYPQIIPMIPLPIYSFFHICNFININARRSLPASLYSLYRTTIESLLQKVLNVQTVAMYRVAYFEFMGIFAMFFGFFFGQVGLLLIFGYYYFLIFRYISSGYSRSVMDEFGAKIDGFFHRPSIPPMIIKVYDMIRGFLRKPIEQQQI